MAKQDQFEYFHDLYRRQDSRYVELINRGKLFLTIVTIYFAALAFDAPDLANFVATISAYSLVLLALAVTVLALSMIFILRGVMIKSEHANPGNAWDIVEKSEHLLLAEDEFWDRRIIEFAAAIDNNFHANERRARDLKYAAILLVLAVGLHAALLITILGVQLVSPADVQKEVKLCYLAAECNQTSSKRVDPAVNVVDLNL